MQCGRPDVRLALLSSGARPIIWPAGQSARRADPARRARVSHYIAEPCIGVKDTACVDVCPVDCIHPRKDEPDFAAQEMLFIDPETCIDCGLCVDECPVDAIFPEDELPEKWKGFIERNTAYFANKQK
jgi:ferredoxin